MKQSRSDALPDLLYVSLISLISLWIQPSPLFQDAPSPIPFTHVNGAKGQYYMHEIMGPGAALFDYDGDGDLDVFLPQGEGRSRLFRNDLTVGASRRGRSSSRMSPIAPASPSRTYGMGTAVGDYDNDGDLDLFVTSFGADTLYRNNGDGTFTDVDESGRRERCAVEHERRLSRFRPRQRSRSLCRQLSRLHDRRQQDLPRPGRRARLLQSARVSLGARPVVPKRGARPIRERHRARRHRQIGRQRTGRVGRRLQRGWVARSLRGQRCDGEPVVDQSQATAPSRTTGCSRERR